MRISSPLTILLLLLSFNLLGQGVGDAVLYSQSAYEGTGRNMAMGSATGAMGGDVTAAYINPAGLGLYRNSEMTFTTGLQHALVKTDYYDNRHLAGRTNVSIPNFGYVIASECSNYKPLRFLQFSIALTRTNDHSIRSSAQGLNPNSSMVDSYLQEIDGIDELHDGTQDPGDYLKNYDPYRLHPAWQTYLIDRFQDSTGYYFNSPIPQGHVFQKDVLESKGRTEEWTFATSANIMDRFYIGTSLGVTHLKRTSTRTYTETPENPHNPQNTFTEWSFSEDLQDDAWGLNLKLGLLYAPFRWLRFGIAARTKTFYRFEETWSTATSATLTSNGENGPYFSPTLDNTYTCITPATYTGSAAFIFGQRGMITADFDYLNYGKARLKKNDSFDNTNEEIAAVLKPTFNVRVGSEWRMRHYYVRGGVAYYGSPYGFGNRNNSIKKLALGIGYVSLSNIYWDFAYEISESSSTFTPYQYYVNEENIVSPGSQHHWRNKLVATMKIKL